jgi:transcriptional regulator with XRE-family HTH domain
MTAPTIYASVVRRIRDAGLETADIATATGADPTTVSAWMASRRSPTAERRLRLIDLVVVVERATAVMDPDYVPVWLNKRVQALDDDRPLERIAQGDTRAVLGVLSRLENDAFS